MKPLRSSIHHRAASGFTLIEWMVVVALLLLLITLAAPSVRELIAVQRLQGVHGSLVTDLQFARSEAVRQRRALRFDLGGDTAMTCYIIYSPGISGSCACTRAPGSACTGSSQEIRTVQVPRSLGVTLAASSSRGPNATFDGDTGRSEPGDLSIALTGAVRGQLRVGVNATGRVTSCSPDGSIRQVPRCT